MIVFVEKSQAKSLRRMCKRTQPISQVTLDKSALFLIIEHFKIDFIPNSEKVEKVRRRRLQILTNEMMTIFSLNGSSRL